MKINIKDCPPKLSGIYKINFPNGKSYIGKAVDIRSRIKEHNYDKRQPILYNAIKKYWNNNITEFEILEKISDRLKLKEREIYWIKYYNTFEDKEKGYNLTPGGDGAALGTENVASKFSDIDVENIRNLLMNTEIPIYKIAEMYNCNRNTISRLDKGKTYFNNKYSYPLRKIKYVPKSGSQNGNAKLNEETFLLIVKDLLKLELSGQEICEKYDISKGTLTNINLGKRYHHSNINYPIRPKNAYLNKKS